MIGRAAVRGPVQLAPCASAGIRGYAQDLATALAALGFDCPVADGARDPAARGRSRHFHFGNSCRSLLPTLATGPSSVVTLHDVVPRQRLLRATLGWLQQPVLARHLAVVHSHHAEQLARAYGFRGETRVIPLAAHVWRLDDDERAEIRARFGGEQRPIVIVAGILKRRKRSPEVIAAASGCPELTFLFVGNAVDGETRAALAGAAGNVVHLPGQPDEEFRRLIACGDMLLNFRTDSVGEASGPVVLAHSVGTPVAGYAVGFMPEYCGDSDVLFPPDVPIAEALATLARRADTFERISEDSPLVTTWEQSAEAHAELYRGLGWLT